MVERLTVTPVMPKSRVRSQLSQIVGQHWTSIGLTSCLLEVTPWDETFSMLSILKI